MLETLKEIHYTGGHETPNSGGVLLEMDLKELEPTCGNSAVEGRVM